MGTHFNVDWKFFLSYLRRFSYDLYLFWKFWNPGKWFNPWPVQYLMILTESYSPFRGRWDSKWWLECKSKSYTESRNYRFMPLFKFSIEKKPRTVVSWFRWGFRFAFRLPFRGISSLIFHGTGLEAGSHSYNSQQRFFGVQSLGSLRLVYVSVLQSAPVGGSVVGVVGPL